MLLCLKQTKLSFKSLFYILIKNKANKGNDF